MKIKARKSNPDGIVRMETSGDVKEVLINEDIFSPKRESVSICFRGRSSSGLVEFTPKEIEGIYESVRRRMHLIKGTKKFLVKSGEAPI